MNIDSSQETKGISEAQRSIIDNFLLTSQQIIESKKQQIMNQFDVLFNEIYQNLQFSNLYSSFKTNIYLQQIEPLFLIDHCKLETYRIFCLLDAIISNISAFFEENNLKTYQYQKAEFIKYNSEESLKSKFKIIEDSLLSLVGINFKHVQCFTQQNKEIAYEDLRNFTLQNLIDEKHQFSSNQIHSILVQVAFAIFELNKMGIVEGNLQPDKIFIDKDIFEKFSIIKIKLGKIFQVNEIQINYYLQANSTIIPYGINYLITKDLNYSIVQFIQIFQYLVCEQTTYNLSSLQKILEYKIQEKWVNDFQPLLNSLISKFNERKLDIKSIIDDIKRSYTDYLFKTYFVEESPSKQLINLQCIKHNLKLKYFIKNSFLCKKCIMQYEEKQTLLKSKIKNIILINKNLNLEFLERISYVNFSNEKLNSYTEQEILIGFEQINKIDKIK